MQSQTCSMSLFATSADDAARTEAIDELHNSTAIYTAEAVVDQLVDRLDWPRGAARLLDSSCGDGVFLGRALIKALASRAYTDAQLLEIIEGWEIHPHACHQARARVSAILIAHGRTPAVAHNMAEKMVHNRDFLTDAPTTASFDSIVGNPPYLRWLNVPQLLRDEYAAHVPTHAAADLLHSFIDRCARTLRPGGQMALVTADSWMFSLGAATLREEIGASMSVEHLERLDAKTAFTRPKQRRAGTPPRVNPVAVVLAHHKQGQALTREPIYPGADSARYAGLQTLQDVAEVRLGPYLGPAGVFVVTGAEAAASGLPKDVLIPAVDNDDVIDGVLRQPTRYAVLTRPDVAPCPAVAGHIERQKVKTGMRLRPGKAWLPKETFYKLDLTHPSLMVLRIAKTPKGIQVPAGVMPFDHNLSVVCKNLETLAKVEKALASDLAAQWLSEHAARLEGGYFAITAPLLRKIPIELP